MELKELGQFIIKRREFLQLRQEDLAEMSGITIKTIHLVEQGKGNPSFETLQKLSKVLGLEMILQIKNLS